MKKLTKLFAWVVAMTLSANAFASTELAASTVTLKANSEGYKLKFIANLSDLPIIGGKWYPDLYNKDIISGKILQNDLMEEETQYKIIVNNGYIYRLTSYKMYDKYSKAFNTNENQLRLCRSQIGSSQWDCSNMLDSSSMDMGSFSYYSAFLVPSPDGDKIAGFYTNSDKQNFTFEYNPTNNQTLQTKMYPDSFVDRFQYYKHSTIFSPDKIINLATKEVFVKSYFNIYSKNYSCRYDFLSFGMANLQDGIYVLRNNRLYNVDGTFQSGYFLGSQIGELNTDYLGDKSVLLKSLTGRIQFSGNNIYLAGNIAYKSGNTSNSYNVFNIYYLPKTADKTKEWKVLPFAVNVKDSFNASMMGYRLIKNQNKLYILIKLYDSNLGRSYMYLYEVSK